MGNKAIGRDFGDILVHRSDRFFNRTGQTVLRGELVMLDLAQSATETDSLRPGDDGSIFANVITPTDAAVQEGRPILVALEDILDNAAGRCLIEGMCDVMMTDDDVSAVNIAANERLGYDATTSVTDRSVDGHVTSERALGMALEAAAASGGTNDQTLKKAYWWGGNWGKGVPST